MAKAVRWQIPFVSLTGTRYRIDIYDEGFSGTPVELRGGSVPFTTDEDNNGDYFAPVRIQTGNIQVCTAIPGGGTLDLATILPENNISRPVRLINLSASNKIEWQGFLSCEAYAQQYTTLPEILSLPVISVLEAMASVELNLSRSGSFTQINLATYGILNEIVVQCGLTMFTHINYSKTDFRIFTKYIDQCILFNIREYNNDTGTTYAIQGLSAKEALARLCTFMGWIAREQGTEIYLERIGETIGMRRDTLSGFNTSFNTGATDVPLTAIDMASLTWWGVNHQRTIMQGANIVQVTARVEEYKLGLGMPETPLTSLAQNPDERSEDGWGYVDANTNRTYYSSIDLRTLYVYWNIPSNIAEDPTYLNMYNNIAATYYYQTVMWQDVSWYQHFADIIEGNAPGTYYQYLVAFFCVWYPSRRQLDYEEGLMVVGAPIRLYTTMQGAYFNVQEQNFGTVDYLYRQRGMLNFRASDGYIRLNVQVSAYLTTDGLKSQLFGQHNVAFAIAIQFGDKWAYKSGSNYGWTTGASHFMLDIDSEGKGPQNYSGMTEEKEGLFIPITSDMSGEVSVYIYPETDGYCAADNANVANVTGFVITSLQIDYVPPKDRLYLKEDKSENKYIKLLSTNFRNEVKIESELATSLNSPTSPSLIMNSASEPTTFIDYTNGASTKARRPEKDLLSRMAEYYGAARQQLKLEVQHPTAAALPLLKLNGIGDGKKYLPLAESRDWAQDKSTLTCFETVNNA